MTLKSLNSPYLFKTKLRFFGCPIRTTGIFLPKYGNRKLKASLSKKWLITNSSSPCQFCKYIYDSTAHASSETQGQSVGPGEKARRKFSSTGGKAPGYRLSPDHFQTVKRMLAPDWAQKMLCIIVPNRRTASPEFFS